MMMSVPDVTILVLESWSTGVLEKVAVARCSAKLQCVRKKRPSVVSTYS